MKTEELRLRLVVLKDDANHVQDLIKSMLDLLDRKEKLQSILDTGYLSKVEFSDAHTGKVQVDDELEGDLIEYLNEHVVDETIARVMNISETEMWGKMEDLARVLSVTLAHFSSLRDARAKEKAA